MSPLRLTLAVAATALLASCASDPVPDLTYYHLPAVEGVAPQPGQPFPYPIVVDPLIGDGAHGEQAILYAEDAGGSLRGYHYQLWSEPPERMLQRRLIEQLRAAKASAVVADNLSSGLRVLRVSGVIVSYERVHAGKDWLAKVDLEMRVDDSSRDLPLLIKSYAAAERAENDTMNATVRAFGRATDRALAEFGTDLAALPR